jgi:hypothetical protein
LNQDVRVIVNDLREQARSHIWIVSAFDFAVASTEWWGKSVLLTFDWAGIPAVQK